MPINPQPAEQPSEAEHPSEVPVVHASTEEDLSSEVRVVHAEDEAAAVAALNAGDFVTADADILEKLGFADFGEVAELEDFLDDLLP